MSTIDEFGSFSEKVGLAVCTKPLNNQVHVRNPCKWKETDQLSDYLQLQQLDKCAPSAHADNLTLE